MDKLENKESACNHTSHLLTSGEDIYLLQYFFAAEEHSSEIGRASCRERV